MANSDGLRKLASASAKVRVQRRMLLERLKSFEIKLLESMEGLNCCGTSKYVTLSTWDHEESGLSGGKIGWLFFDGEKLSVRTQCYSDTGQEANYEDWNLDSAQVGWLARLSAPIILNSLVVDISMSLEDKHNLFATANEWLNEFVETEKSVIDADLNEHFKLNPTLLDSWQKARSVVESDPEDSITRSSSHLETVLKTCLKQLGDTGYETMSVDKLSSRAVKKIRDSGVIDGGALQSLTGLGTVFHGIGTTRNSSSTAHGKNEGYLPPSVDVAQLINHLAGVGSAFILKQTGKILKGHEKSQRDNS